MPAASPGVAPTLAGARRRVLYVEDNALNVLLFEEVLRREPGVELRVAISGEEALALVQHWTPELLIIDMNLPGVTGTELLRALRLHPALAGVPAVVCSADAMPEDRARALAAGFDHYWTKPIDVHALPGAITAALQGGTTDPANERVATARRDLTAPPSRTRSVVNERRAALHCAASNPTLMLPSAHSTTGRLITLG